MLPTLHFWSMSMFFLLLGFSKVFPSSSKAIFSLVLHHTSVSPTCLSQSQPLSNFPFLFPPSGHFSLPLYSFLYTFLLNDIEIGHQCHFKIGAWHFCEEQCWWFIVMSLTVQVYIKQGGERKRGTHRLSDGGRERKEESLNKGVLVKWVWWQDSGWSLGIK